MKTKTYPKLHKLLRKTLASRKERINIIKRPLNAYYCMRAGEKITFRLGFKIESMIAPNKVDQGWPDFCVIFILSLCALQSKQTQCSVHFGRAHSWLFVQVNERVHVKTLSLSWNTLVIFERFDFLSSKAHFPANVFHEITWTTDELKRNVYEQNIIIILVFKIIIHRALKSGIRTELLKAT